MSARRETILAAVAKAAAIHKGHRLRENLRACPGAINVSQLILEHRIALQFRPLERLLGACVSERGNFGILVNSERPLSLQRFTEAHEFGHACLDHQVMLDIAVGAWRDGATDLREVAADAFASELLMPTWLFKIHANRLGYGKKDLSSPDVAYQLALRMGVSYEAICVAMKEQKLISGTDAATLKKTSPKQCKERLLREFSRTNSRPDVWRLGPEDNRGCYIGGPDDLLVLNLQERAASGYQWDVSEAVQEGFSVLEDQVFPTSSDLSVIGSARIRRLILSPPPQRSSVLSLFERRPWERVEEHVAAVRVRFDSFGAERLGLSRQERINMGLPAAA